MNPSNRLSGVLAWLIWSALGIIAILVAGGGLSAAGSAGQLAEFLPVLAPVQGPLVGLAMALAICIEALLVLTALLVGCVRSGRIFHPDALRFVDRLVVAVVVSTLLVVGSLFFIPGPPQLFLLVEAAVPVGATVALVLLVMRSLLRRAIAMRVQLETVA